MVWIFNQNGKRSVLCNFWFVFFSRLVLGVVFSSSMHFRSQIWDSWSLLPPLGGGGVRLFSKLFLIVTVFVTFIILSLSYAMECVLKIQWEVFIRYIVFCTFTFPVFLPNPFCLLCQHSWPSSFLPLLCIKIPHANVVQNTPWYAACFSSSYFLYMVQNMVHVLLDQVFFSLPWMWHENNIMTEQ